MKPRRGKTILFADDDIALQKTVKTYLDREGYDMRIANDGEACVNAVKMDRPSLLLLDIGMPKLDGIGVIEALAEAKLLADLPIVLFTGTANRETVVRAAKLGIADYLVKPFALRDLGLRVHRQLDELTVEEARLVVSHAQTPKDSAPYATIPEAAEPQWKIFASAHGGLEACVLLLGEIGTADIETATRIYLRRGAAGWRPAWPSGAPPKTR